VPVVELLVLLHSAGGFGTEQSTLVAEGFRLEDPEFFWLQAAKVPAIIQPTINVLSLIILSSPR
jgi:hypothetical protein